MTHGLAEGKWKYPRETNAFDDDVAENFKEYQNGKVQMKCWPSSLINSEEVLDDLF